MRFKAPILIKREFMTKIRSKYFIFATLIGPFLMAFLMGAPMFFMQLSGEEIKEIVIVKETLNLNEEISLNFQDEISTGEKKFQLKFIKTEEFAETRQHLMKQVENNQIKAIVKIPDSVVDGGQITYISSSLGDIEFIESVRTRISNAVNSLRMTKAGVESALIEKLTRPVGLETLRAQRGEVKTKSMAQDFMTAYIFVFILYITTILYSSSILQGVVEEKSSRIVEVLLSSCNTFDMMLGKLFGAGSVGLFQFTIWGAFGGIIYFFIKNQFPDLPVMITISPDLLIYFIVFFLIGYFQYSTMFLVAGALSSNQDDAKQMAQPVTMLIVLPFIMSFLGMNNPGHSMVHILSHIPFFTPMLMFVRVTVSSVSIYEVLTAVIVNILFIFLIIYLASKIYRVGILMYGKRPKIKEVYKWMFQ
ncbi:MAG: ABC transporter permease [Candidatus Muiribacteriota bacterium]